MKTTLLRNAYLLRGERFRFERAPFDILVAGERIAAIEPAGRIADAQEAIDLSSHLIVPGLINGHLHSHEHFQRGRLENLPLELWQHHVRTPVPIPYTPRQVYLRTLIGAIECLRTGTTCLVDDLSLRGAIREDYVEAVFQAYEDIGIRALVGFAMLDRSIVDTFPFVELLPPELVERMRAAPRPQGGQYLELVRRYSATRHPQTSRVGILVSASAPQRCTEAFLIQCRRLADELALPVITHVQETRLQVVTGLEFYGCPIVEYLDRIGFLKPSTTLIHAVWLNPREIDAMARTGATAQHNPWSNLMLGSGVQPVRSLLKAGVNVSMGSDGSCSTSTVSMLNTAGTAAAISKIRGDDYSEWLSAEEALHAATSGGARALGLDGAVGALEVGALADLAAYRTDTVTFTPMNDPVRQLIYAERGAGLEFMMIGGEVAMSCGALTRIDERRILAEIRAEMATLDDALAEGERSGAALRAAMETVYRRSLSTGIAADTIPARIAGAA